MPFYFQPARAVLPTSEVNKLREDLQFRIQQHKPLNIRNLNCNSSLLTIFDRLDREKNKEITLQEFKDGLSGGVLNMNWSNDQLESMFHVRAIFRDLIG